MPTVYGVFGSPFVRKVLVFLAEKGVSFDHEQVNPFQPPADYRKLSPLGKIPAFRDGDRVLADSSVICAYLERVKPTPALYPSDAYDYARALWFEEYGDGGLSPIFGPKIFMQKVIGPLIFKHKPDMAAIEKVVKEELPPMFDYLEGEIGDKQFLVANQFSIADIGVATQFVNLALAGYGIDAKRWPKLNTFLARIHGRPSFSAVIDKEKKAFQL
jgi:glutathione S-transferase